MPLDLSPAWTEPVDLGILRESDDPLGFRSAANRIAALMCSPITSRTTSVRHLSFFCWAAHCASPKSGGPIDRDQFDRAARVITIAATGALVSLHLEPAQKLALTLPGRRKAGSIAERILNMKGRDGDFDLPLLGSAHAQGLWGTYGALARNLGLLESRGSAMALSEEGRDWATRLPSAAFPYMKPAQFLSEDLAENERVIFKLVECFDLDDWPSTIHERNGFLNLLDREQLKVRPRLKFLMTRAADRATLSSISRDPEAQNLLGVDGEMITKLAERATELNRLIKLVELPFRTIYSEKANPPAPDLLRFKGLLEWADHQGLEMGALFGAPSTWHAVKRHHTTIFHRRGRPSWGDLSAQGLLHLPDRPRLPDYRFNALRSLGHECELGGDFR